MKTIRKSLVVEYQLGLTAREEVAFEEGGTTVLTPARWVPELSNRWPLSLEGWWEVTYWPFPAAEESLLVGGCAEVKWQEVEQPGKVFYYDPDESPDQIEGWNRVTLEHVDPEDGALLRRQVRIPEEWAGKRVLLRFEGIYPAGRVYFDGKPVAEQWSGLTPLEVDLTDLAVPGQVHTVAVRLYRRHKDVQLDMPRHALEFCGLSRACFLHAVEPVHVTETYIRPTLDDDYETGVVSGEGLVRNATDREAQIVLQATLSAPDGTVIASEFYGATLRPGAEDPVGFELQAGPVRVWNAETPNLYDLTLRITCPGQADQELTSRLGFRRFEIKDQRCLLNGKPVKFRGVNHLTFHPEYGMYTPEEWLRDCLLLMKKANVNAIRTHFFGPPELTALCDELGLYFLQELPIDWGHGYLADPEKVGPVLHRMHACVRRDRNHPSIMVWSIGNENMPKDEATHEVFMEHLRLFNQMVKRVDRTRPTMFPPPGPAGRIKGIFEARLSEIADIHYSFNLIRDFNETGVLSGNPRTWEPSFEPDTTREELLQGPWQGVWFSSEYGITNQQSDLLNAPYVSIIADVMEDPLSGKNTQQVFIDRLTREWGYMRDDPTCLGGAYFPWMASGAGDPWGWVRWGEDADWGVVMGDLTPKSNFWALRVIFSPVRFPARLVWHKGEDEFRFTVHNDYNSIDLAQCTFRTQMGGGPPYMSMLREFRDVAVNCPPASSTEMVVPIWNQATKETLEKGSPVILRVTVLDPEGFRPIMADILVIPEGEQPGAEAAIPLGPDAPDAM